MTPQIRASVKDQSLNMSIGGGEEDFMHAYN